MEDIKFLSLDEVVIVHEKMIEIGRGSSGIRDIELLHAAIERPKVAFMGSFLYPSIIEMAGVILQSLVKNHPFIDGNKRTAFFSTILFLQKNDIELTATDEEIVDFVVRVDTKSLSIEAIAKWLAAHS